VVVYFDVEGMPGKYFACARYGTMSAGSCSRNYLSAPHAVKSGRLEGCIGCPIGRGHSSGEDKAAAPIVQPAPAYRPVCLRCRRSGRERSSRLIGRMRLVRCHTICVSCYNREREVLQGKNAKGDRPKKWAGLFRTQVSYVRGNQVVVRASLQTPVLDRIEAALIALRQIKAEGVFFAAPPIVRLP
jgi:hypothetical protein